MLNSKLNWKYIESKDETITLLDGISPIITNLLIQRGISNPEEANKFLSPRIEDLHSPERLNSIQESVDRVIQAITDKEKILIFGDYDADGVSSTTVLYKALEEIGARVDYYIPNRFTEGYGPNEEAFIWASKNSYTLIITVDTGIAAVEEAIVAKKLGIDLIITDHHEPQDELPEAYAIIHPKLSPDYPFDELAGVGVAFKFAEKILGYFPKHLLQFTAIGTIADLVPLVDENRILAYHGLQALTTSNNPGIKALKKVCDINGKVTEEDVGFSLGPRINAVGRLQDASLAVELFLTDSYEEAEEIAYEIQELNEKRKEIVNNIVKEAEQMVQGNESDVIIVAKEGWNEGVLGIVASRLVKKYDRPAIVLTIKKELNEAKGSARSIPAFDLFTNCMKIRDLFTHFGGHSQAAGMTLPVEHIPKVQANLQQLIQEQLSEEDFKQEIEIAQRISINELTQQLVEEINSLAPFGMKNPKPVFEFKDVPKEVRQIGSNKDHLKIQFQSSNSLIEGIGFGIGEVAPYISPKVDLSVVGEIGINEWNGIKKLQIMIKDIKIDDWQLFDFRGKKNVDLPMNKNSSLVLYRNRRPNINLPTITYDTNELDLPYVDNLYIFDLPDDLQDLVKIVQATEPKNIYACYHVDNGAYLQSFPNREEFAWLYKVIRKRKVIDDKRETKVIMDARGWSKDRINFLYQVFFELGFVTIENGVIRLNPNPEKRDLKDSITYQQRLNKMEIEKTLYYSNYEELRNWFEDCMKQVGNRKEEAVHGL